MEDTARLILFTLVWTAVWMAPLPRLGSWAELVAGLVPFAAFGLRVFAGFFVGVPDDDPVHSAVSPLLNWINGRAGFPPYAWVLDATITLGLAWLASAFDIPRRSRVATAWIMPAVAVLALVSLGVYGLPIERLLAASIPGPFLGLAAGGAIGAAIRWTPSPIASKVKQRAGIVAILTIPLAVVAGLAMLRLASGLPSEHAAQVESFAALGAGLGAGVAALRLRASAEPISLRDGGRGGGWGGDIALGMTLLPVGVEAATRQRACLACTHHARPTPQDVMGMFDGSVQSVSQGVSALIVPLLINPNDGLVFDTSALGQ